MQTVLTAAAARAAPPMMRVGESLRWSEMGIMTEAQNLEKRPNGSRSEMRGVMPRKMAMRVMTSHAIRVVR